MTGTPCAPRAVFSGTWAAVRPDSKGKGEKREKGGVGPSPGGSPFLELTAGVDAEVWGHLPYTHFPFLMVPRFPFGASPLEYSLGGILDPGVCPPTAEADDFQRPLCPSLSLPTYPWVLSPEPWALGWAQGWKRCLEYTVPMAAAQHTARQPLLPAAPSGRLACPLGLFPAGAPSFQAVLETPTSFP